MKTRTGISTLFSYIALVSLVLTLQACGGGGGGTTTASSVNTSLASAARGYYEGLATIDVAAGDLTISSPDFKAIIVENEFNIIYKGTQNLLYKGTFTEVTATTFKATLRVYRAGNFIATAAIDNGTIDAGVSFKGTITGTGTYTTTDYANSVGDIELTYNNSNSLTPPAYVASKEWQDASTGNVTFNTATNATYVFAVDSTPPEFHCAVSTFDTTDVVNEQTGRIRSFITVPLSTCGGGGALDGAQIKGYLTNYMGAGTDDDRMLVIVSDDNYAYVGILPCVGGTGTCF